MLMMLETILFESPASRKTSRAPERGGEHHNERNITQFQPRRTHTEFTQVISARSSDGSRISYHLSGVGGAEDVFIFTCHL